jgi:hypothetical protein
MRDEQAGKAGAGSGRHRGSSWIAVVVHAAEGIISLRALGCSAPAEGLAALACATQPAALI